MTGTVIVELCSEHQSYFDTAALPQAPRRFGGNIGDVEPPMAKDLVPLVRRMGATGVVTYPINLSIH